MIRKEHILQTFLVKVTLWFQSGLKWAIISPLYQRKFNKI